MRRCFWFLFLLSVWGLPGCVEEFGLPPSAQNLENLVVDGGVFIETGTAKVKLTRTQNLISADKPPVLEGGAAVTVEDKRGSRYRLSESTDGTYTAAGLPLQYGQEYRLRIKTKEGKEYESAFVTAQKAPPIMELSWHVERGGVQVEVSTRGEGEGSRFYRWEFTETYQYETMLFSSFRYHQNRIFRRSPQEEVFRCWKSESSRSILIHTTRQLTENVVNHFPVAFRLGDGDHFTRMYSILVRQYAMSQQEYEYWQMMQKNTENVGSLFDAQPSFVTGNLTCVTDPEELVFGYFAANSVAEKRLFISADEVRSHHFGSPGMVCETFPVPEPDIHRVVGEGNLRIIDSLVADPPRSPSLPPVYTVASRICSDCREKGGSTIKPDFWP